MIRKFLPLLLLVFLLLSAGTATAQSAAQADSTTAPPPPRAQPKQPEPHKFEITGQYGYVWTFEYSGVDIKDSSFWAASVDFNVHPFAQLELLYRRQDTDMVVKGLTTQTFPISVEYFHIGLVKAIKRSPKAMPYTVLTLGASRFNDKDLSSDEWKFSVIPGIGVKYYASERIALRCQADLPISFLGGGVGFGTGGVSVGGWGITQIGVSAGLSLLL